MAMSERYPPKYTVGFNWLAYETRMVSQEMPAYFVMIYLRCGTECLLFRSTILSCSRGSVEDCPKATPVLIIIQFEFLIKKEEYFLKTLPTKYA